MEKEPMTRITKLAQLEALPNGAQVTDATGRQYTLIRNGYPRLQQVGQLYPISLAYAANNLGPFTVKDNQ